MDADEARIGVGEATKSLTVAQTLPSGKLWYNANKILGKDKAELCR